MSHDKLIAELQSLNEQSLASLLKHPLKIIPLPPLQAKAGQIDKSAELCSEHLNQLVKDLGEYLEQGAVPKPTADIIRSFVEASGRLGQEVERFRGALVLLIDLKPERAGGK